MQRLVTRLCQSTGCYLGVIVYLTKYYDHLQGPAKGFKNF